VAGYETILAKPFENRYVLDKVPDYYERLKRSYDMRFYEQEVLGEYLNLSAGRVYESFHRDRNVVDVQVNPDLPLLWALDFNVDPMCSVVAQKLGDEVRVLDEIVLRRASTHQACEEFCARFPNHQAQLIVYGDASGARMQTAGTTDYKIVKERLTEAGYRDYRLKVPPANPSVRDRVLLTNAKLGSADGETRLFVSPRCKELILDLEEVVYKPDSLVIDKESDSKRTHLSDALGYLIWQECRPQVVFGERNRPLF
jgi:hypothetical protein